jgi:ParB family chromosome partitioning protein
MASKKEFASMDLISAFKENTKKQDAIKLSEIKLNPNQPRVFNKDKVDDLMDSIKRLGLLEPVVVRKESGGYSLVAGERRYRAVEKLGWKEIPARIVEANADLCYEMALAENEKRKSLNPWEVGKAISYLRKDLKKTAFEVSQALGYSERYIKQLSSIGRLDKKDIETFLNTGADASVKNLEALLRKKEGRGGEIISPRRENGNIIQIDLTVLGRIKKDSFLKELDILKKKYGI